MIKKYTLIIVILFIVAAIALSIFFYLKTGSKIAFLKLTDGFWQVWVMNEDGTNPVQITKSKIDKVNISWSKSRNRVLYCTNLGEVYIINLLTRMEKKLPLDLSMTNAEWSPDGKEIAFSFTSGENVFVRDLWVSDLDGRNRKRVAKMKGLQHSPVWTADGKEIIFLSGVDQISHDLWVVKKDGTEKRLLIQNALYNFDPSCSIKGEIAFSSNRTGNYEIWRFNPNIGEQIQLTDDPSYDSEPSWSPDGNGIVFISNRMGSTEIWGMDKDGKDLFQLTNFHSDLRTPSWSR